MVDDFIELGVWFSISGYFFRPNKSEKLEVFEHVPDDRLLVESDAPDMLPPAEWDLAGRSDEVNHPANISRIYEAVAEWKGESKESVVELVRETIP